MLDHSPKIWSKRAPSKSAHPGESVVLKVCFLTQHPKLKTQHCFDTNGPPECHPCNSEGGAVLTHFFQKKAERFRVLVAVLYGSWAVGFPRPDSDIDVAVVFEEMRELQLDYAAKTWQDYQ